MNYLPQIATVYLKTTLEATVMGRSPGEPEGTELGTGCRAFGTIQIGVFVANPGRCSLPKTNFRTPGGGVATNQVPAVSK